MRILGALGWVILLLAIPVSTSAAGRQAVAVPKIVNGFVAGITVIDGGAGYTSVPMVTISSVSGGGAQALAIVEGGTVVQVIVLAAGAGYSTLTTVRIASPPIGVIGGLGSSWGMPPQLSLDVTQIGGVGQNYALLGEGIIVSWSGGTFWTNELSGLGVVQIASPVDYWNGPSLVGRRADGSVLWHYGGMPYDLPVHATDLAVGSQSIYILQDGELKTLTREGRIASTGLTNCVQVKAGPSRALVILNDQTVAVGCLSCNGVGTNTPPFLTNVVAVAAGYQHNLALRSDGSVVEWGRMDSDQMPGARLIQYNGGWVASIGLSDVISIAAGNGTSMALRSDGSLVVWGGEFDPTQFEGLRGVTLLPSWGATYLVGNGPFVRGLSRQGWRDEMAEWDIYRPALPEDAMEGEQLRMRVDFTSVSVPSFQWFFDGKRIQGATNDHLSFERLQYANSGNYSCLVRLPTGSQMQTVPEKLLVYAGNDLFDKPRETSTVGERLTDFPKTWGRESEEPLHAGIKSPRTLWYTYTAPASEQVSMDTLGSSFDTVLAVYVGEKLEQLLPIAADDDSGDQTLGGRTSRLRFQALKGTTYRIAVGSYRDISMQEVQTVRLNVMLDRPALSITSTTESRGITLGARPGSEVFLEGSTNLTTWFPLSTNIMNADGILKFPLLPSSTGSHFFRTIQP